jgi:hypothetical protein
MDETLHSAARRVVRFFNIVMAQGGLVDPEFEHAMLQLSKQVEKENKKAEDKRNEDRRD